MELPRRDRLRHVVPEDDVGDVRAGDHYALVAGQPAHPADVVEPLDLRGGATDRLDVAQLVDRPGDRDALVDGDLREGREEGVELRRGGRVPVDVVVELLERQAGVEEGGLVLPEAVREEAAQDEEPLVVDAPGHVAFALHHHDAASTCGGDARDARRASEGAVAEVVHRERVDLAHTFAVRRDVDRAFLHRLLDTFRDQRGAVRPLIEGSQDVSLVDQWLAVLRGPVVGLAHHVEEAGHVRGEPALVFHHP